MVSPVSWKDDGILVKREKRELGIYWCWNLGKVKTVWGNNDSKVHKQNYLEANKKKRNNVFLVT